MEIRILTKREIVDELKIRQIEYSGRLDELDFAKRLFDLKSLPSMDPRCKDMESDFRQHRINNYDWDYWWMIEDERVDLLNDDLKFLEFLCLIIHPLVRSGEESVELREIFNSYLVHDGYKIIEDRKIYSGSTFKGQKIDGMDFEIQNTISTENEFVKEHYQKIDSKIKEEDFSGVITNSRSLIECAIADIYKRITGFDLTGQGNLQDGYKKIKTLLRLHDDDTSNDAFKSILRSFVTIIDGLDRLSNQMGDRHRAFTKAERNYALFCANSAKIFVSFIYSVLDYQYGQNESIFDRILELLDSNRRVYSRESLLADREISKLSVKLDPYIKTLFKDRLIQNFEINSFRGSDIFFAFLRLFFDALTLSDILKIFRKEKGNSQALGLCSFLKYCELNNKELVNDKISIYIKANDESIDINEIPF